MSGLRIPVSLQALPCIEHPVQEFRDLLAANGYAYHSHGEDFFFHESMHPPASMPVLCARLCLG